jgi:transcriptional regulator with XRE-family HTH domain
MNNLIGKKIKSLRIEHGFNQKDLAKKLNITQSAYSRLERGETRIDIERVIKLGEIYNVEPTDLIFNQEGYNNTFNIHNNPNSQNGYIHHFHYTEIKEVYDDWVAFLKKENEALKEENAQLRKELSQSNK